MGTTYTIAEVAERSGFPASTLRYWEGAGVLPPSDRAPNGYRAYDDAALERLAFIARAKQLGCSLSEIRDLVTTWEGQECGSVQDQLRHLVAAKVDDAEVRITDLVALVGQLRHAADQLSAPSPAGACAPGCGCTGPDLDPGPASAPPLRAAPRPGEAEVPIACALGPAGQVDQSTAWHRLLGDATRREALPDGVRVTFPPETDVADIARLAAAEQSCCPFFGFALTIDDRGTALEVRAPADATEVVTALFGDPSPDSRSGGAPVTSDVVAGRG